MNNYVHNYSLLKFCPYPETNEFIVVGVLVVTSQTNQLSFRLQNNNFGRITRFFPEIDQEFIKYHFNIMKENLQFYIKEDQTNLFDEIDNSVVFKGLVRPREGMLTFSSVKTLVYNDHLNIADHLFDQYVQHQFAKKSVHTLNNSVKQFLKEWDVSDRFRKKSIHCLRNTTVDLPFAEVDFDDKVLKGIIPLSLSGTTATINTVEHRFDRLYGDLRRLDNAGKLPEHIIFPYETSRKEHVKSHTLESLNTLEEYSHREGTVHISNVEMKDSDKFKRLILLT